jgi:peptide/nickel transport system permease protein
MGGWQTESTTAAPGDTGPAISAVAFDSRPVESPAGGGSVRHGAVRFVARRAAAGVVTLFVVSIAIFLATAVLPGNTAEVVLGRNATPAAIAQLDHQLNLDRPLIDRYLSWLGGAVHGQFGYSAVARVEAQTTSVASTLGAPLGHSLVLAVITLLILLPLAIAIGTLCGMYAGRAADRVFSFPLLVLGGLPEFVTGTLLIWLFFTRLNVLPPVSQLAPGQSPLSDPAKLVLPVATLVLGATSVIARQVRAGVRDVMRQDFVRVARLNGIPERRVVLRYGLRNALAPTVQVIAHAIQYLLGGMIIVENVFTYPGIGQYLVNAVGERDIPEVQAAALILAALYVALNIAADLIVILLVPRLRTELA